MRGLIISVPERSRCVTQTISLPPSLVAKTQHRSLSCDRVLSYACWGEPPPCIPERVMQRGDTVWEESCELYVCLSALKGVWVCCSKYVFVAFQVIEALHPVQVFKHFFSYVFRKQAVFCSLYVYIQKCACVRFLCNVLRFTSNPDFPLLPLCPALPQPHGDALGSGNMGRGT